MNTVFSEKFVQRALGAPDDSFSNEVLMQVGDTAGLRGLVTLDDIQCLMEFALYYVDHSTDFLAQPSELLI